MGSILAPDVFMPFGQHGHIVNTAPMKKKLDARAIQAQYLRALGPDLLLVWKSESKTIATIRAKEFILSQNTPKERATHKRLFEQAAELPTLFNNAYDSWYSDCILHPTNAREKARKVGKKRMPKKIKSNGKTKANFFNKHNDRLEHLKKRKALVPNEVGLAVTTNTTWFDPVEEGKEEVRLFPRPTNVLR